jgi:hypothetical protein
MAQGYAAALVQGRTSGIEGVRGRARLRIVERSGSSRIGVLTFAVYAGYKSARPGGPSRRRAGGARFVAHRGITTAEPSRPRLPTSQKFAP